MKEEMMTAGTGGFSGSAAATGPNAGYDPVMKFRSKIKSKKDKKLVMPGNQLKAETDDSYQEKLYNIISERQLARINKLREEGYELSEDQLNEFLGGLFGGAKKSAPKPQPKPQPPSPPPAPMSPMGGMGGMGRMGSMNLGANKPNIGMSNPKLGGSINKPEPKSVPAPTSAIASPSMGGDKSSSSLFAKKMRDRNKIKNKPSSMMSKGGEVKEAAVAPQDQPVGLYQYKVTVPEMGTTIIYASSPTELMIKFRMLFNPRFIKQIKIERISPSKAGELFYVKRLKHIRNIKSD